MHRQSYLRTKSRPHMNQTFSIGAKKSNRSEYFVYMWGTQHNSAYLRPVRWAIENPPMEKKKITPEINDRYFPFKLTFCKPRVILRSRVRVFHVFFSCFCFSRGFFLFPSNGPRPLCGRHTMHGIFKHSSTTSDCPHRE